MSDPTNNDELSVEELEDVAGGTTTNVNGCNGGTCYPSDSDPQQ